MKILVILLMLVFVVSATAGDGKPPKKDKTPNEWVLMDSDGKQVGDVVKINLDTVLVALTIAGNPVFLHVSPYGILTNASFQVLQMCIQ